MKRMATITKLKPGVKEQYKKIHDEIWEEVVAANHAAHMQNFTIFYIDDYLFSYYEYTGDDFEADLAKKNQLLILKEWKSTTGEFMDCVVDEEKVLLPEEFWHHDF